MAFDFSRYDNGQLLDLHMKEMERAQTGRAPFLLSHIRKELVQRGLPTTYRPAPRDPLMDYKKSPHRKQ